MKAASYTSERRGDQTRLMVMDKRGVAFSTFAHLSGFLDPSDLLVVNESAVLPASLSGVLERTGEELEIRLAAHEGEHFADFSQWLAVSFGKGDWRSRTEERGAPPALRAGDRLHFGDELSATILSVDERSPRLLHLKFLGRRILEEIYRHGEVIQYAYHRDPLALWDAQTLIGGLPLSVEPPSSLFSLSAERLLALKKTHRVVGLLHGAGLSSTGDISLDALLPLPEPYFVPEATLQAVRETKANGGRIVAFGTSVARALESALESGKGQGITSLKLGPERPAHGIDGLLTGFHEPGTSHFQLECGLVEETKMHNAFEEAKAQGFIGHEYGDLILLWSNEKAPRAYAYAIAQNGNVS